MGRARQLRVFIFFVATAWSQPGRDQNPSRRPPMAKRPRHGGAGRSRLRPLEGKLRRYILNGGLAVPGASAEEVADTLRIHHPEFRRQKLDPFTALVRRVLSSIPSPSSSSSGSDDDDDDGSSASRRRHGAHATTSSSTSVSNEAAAQPQPSPDNDVTKSLLRSQYVACPQTPKRKPAANKQQLEIELAAEKARRLITSDGGASGDAKPDAAASEGIVRGDKGPRFADLGGNGGGDRGADDGSGRAPVPSGAAAAPWG